MKLSRGTGGGLFLLLPALALFALFTVVPLVYVVRLSLYESNMLMVTFRGLGNYWRIFTDDDFRRTIENSLIYMGILTAGWTLIPLFVALMASDLSKLLQAYTRFVFYIPVFASGVIISIVWLYIFHPAGLANWIIKGFGIERQLWLGQRFLAIGAVCTVLIATVLGFNVAIFMASILSVSPQLYDAAKIDGASRLQIKMRIIFPSILPSFFFVVLVAMIGSLQIWETIFVMSPTVQSYNLMFDVFSTAFESGRYGMGAAKTIVLVIMVAALTYGKRRLER